LFPEQDEGKPPYEVSDRASQFLTEIKCLRGRPGIVDTGRASWVDNAGDPRENLDGDAARLRRLTLP
jgi:hypothetical protein